MLLGACHCLKRYLQLRPQRRPQPRQLLLSVCLLASGLLWSATVVHADNSTQEGEWIQYLKQANTKVGSPMPHAYLHEDELIRLTKEDVQRLTGTYEDNGGRKRSKLQFTELNYQADVTEDYLQLRFFYQF